MRHLMLLKERFVQLARVTFRKARESAVLGIWRSLGRIWRSVGIITWNDSRPRCMLASLTHFVNPAPLPSLSFYLSAAFKKSDPCMAANAIVFLPAHLILLISTPTTASVTRTWYRLFLAFPPLGAPAIRAPLAMPMSPARSSSSWRAHQAQARPRCCPAWPRRRPSRRPTPSSAAWAPRTSMTRHWRPGRS